MDQVPTQPNYQSPPQTQSGQTSLPPQATKQNPSIKDYLGRLFAGRINRRNFIISYLFLIVLLVPFGLFLNTDMKLYEGFWGKIELDSIIIVGAIIIILDALCIISITIRRFHDLNRPGWLWLLSVIPLFYALSLLYLIFFSGTKEANNYGDIPEPRLNIKEDILCL